MIFQSILILVCLLTPNDGAVEGLRYTTISWGFRHPSQLLLFSYRLCELTILTVLSVTELSSRGGLSRLLRLVKAAVKAEESFCRLVNAVFAHAIITAKVVATVYVILILHILHIAHVHISHIAKEVSLQIARCAGR